LPPERINSVKINQNREGKRQGLLFLFGTCLLIIAVFLGIPTFLSAHGGGHDETDAKENEKVQHISGGQAPIANQDWIREKTGSFVPLDASFMESDGVRLSLRSIIDRPTLILPIYYFCPNYCSLELAHLAAALKASTFKPGVDFKVIAFSFNANETVADAKNAKKNYLNLLPDDFPADAWKFLVGDMDGILELTDALGYTFKRMPDGSYVHPSALVVLSTDGKIIKYVYGSFLPGDVDMALQEAKQGIISTSVKRLLRYCFNNDSKRSLAFLQNLKLYVLLLFSVLGGLFLWFLRWGGRKKPNTEKGRE
jgi:protein SCO1